MKKVFERSALALAVAGALLLSGCSTLDSGSVPVVDRSYYGSGSSAVVETRAEAEAPGRATDSGRTHTVAPGDTLYNISLRYGLDARELARLNAIDDPTQLRLGQVLRLPESVKAPTSVASSGVRVSRVTGIADEPEETAPIETPVVRYPAEKSSQTAAITNTPDADKAAAEKPVAAKPAAEHAMVPGTQLLWPSRGPVRADYAATKMGLDIGGTKGDVVVAAGAGTVLFVGDGVKGYGNLVIVKHSPQIVTAYGHNSKIVVKVGDKVKAGQKIAELGEAPNGTPTLRFEVRDRGKPVDPMKYLAPRRN